MKKGQYTVILLMLLVFGIFIPVPGAGEGQAADYTITATNSSYGTISPSGIVGVAQGTNQTFIMTPDPDQLDCWGGGKRYLVWNYTVDGVDSGWLESFDPVEYTFTAIDANHTIHAEFSYGFFDVAIFAECAANTTSGPVPLTVNFTQVQVSENTGVLWSFGDNTTSTEENPVHTYTSAGVYEVTFTIFCDNQSFSDLPLGITVNESPIANFTANRTFGAPPMTVQFTDTSTGTPPLDYTWDFGDAATSHEQNPVHTYTNQGSYLVTLTVSNGAGNDTRSADAPIGVFGMIGGDKGFFVVHCDVDGARVFFDDTAMGVIENGTLRVQVYTTATPFFTYTVEKDGYQTFSAPITQYPGKDQTVDLYAQLTPAGPVGTLYVASYPTNATILIDGADYGRTTTFVSKVPAGSRNLTLTKPGYQQYTMTVSVPVNGTKILAPVTLTKGGPSPESTGTLYVASYPAGATILIDGVDHGTTPRFVSQVPAGSRNLTLTKPGYQQYTTTVSVPVSGTKILAPITLTKGGPSPESTGTLYVASYPTGATILINGTDYGTTNRLVPAVPAGNQNLVLIKTGYQPFTTIVSVPAGGLNVLAPITLTKSDAGAGEVGSIQAAVDAASDGEYIVLKKGTYHENVVINKSVTLVGFGPGTTIISGDTGSDVVKGGVFNITRPFPHASSGPTVTLIGMTITGGDANYGGGIFNDAGTLVLSWVSLRENAASLSGGGIYTMGGTVTLNGSALITGNTAPVGGGIINDGGSVILNHGSSITENTAEIAGGLSALQGTVTLNDGSSITNNTATYDGGGIYNNFYSTVTMNGGTISGNSAQNGSGGGVYTDDSSTFTQMGGTISGNSPDDVYQE